MPTCGWPQLAWLLFTSEVSWLMLDCGVPTCGWQQFAWLSFTSEVSWLMLECGVQPVDGNSLLGFHLLVRSAG